VPSPTIDSIAAYLEESPHKSNRVYHIVDAADFPMSLISNIYEALELQDPRSKNRRSKTEKYKYGKKMTTLSFVITRADLLAATKDQVDSLMNRVRDIILKAMDMRREDIRLGNVHMISAHRGWWTTRVKEEIREHGGGVWVVGKANVGKSSFIESCFPKDSKNLEKIADMLESRKQQSLPNFDFDSSSSSSSSSPLLLDPEGLLPPAPREELWPTLPVISSLPGTTVGPIRIPFGRGRGEMIDLPGLDRGTLQDFMQDKHKSDLTMTKRVNPAEQLNIRSSQSLLIGGGLIRITPIVPENCTVLAACFVPLETHVTRTEKAVEIETGVRKYNTGGGDRGNSVIEPEHLNEQTAVQHAGTFTLDTDVTLSHLPSIIKKKWDDHNIKPDLNSLPYRVYSTDILIEGCGWIELTAQIRAKRQSSYSEEEEELPKVQVFTPLGRHVSSRPPLETWNFIRDKRKADKRKGRYMSGSHRPKRNNISHKKRTLHGGKGA
jgi:genetic interactor of prohibitins 3, mitochondrial